MNKTILMIIIGIFFISCDSKPISEIEVNSGAGEKGSKNSSPTPIVEPGECDEEVYRDFTKIEDRPTLVILLEYNNQTFVSAKSVWEDKIFAKNSVSVNNYYNEISNSKFSFKNIGVKKIRLNKNHPDSGASLSIQSDLKDAIKQIQNNIDFASFDVDGDGSLSKDELIFLFIVAGNEDAYSGSNSKNGVWAHQKCIDQSFSLNGIKMMSCDGDGTYAIFGERHGDHDATIGIIAHELGHAAFELPDLYKIGYASHGGIGYFGLMGNGSWAQKTLSEQPGQTPVHMMAWSKYKVGWIEPEIVENVVDSFYYLNSSTSIDYNILKIPLNRCEYLLMENRQASGYDRGLNIINKNFDGGIALWHINKTVLSNSLKSNNIQDDKDNKGVDLVEAKTLLSNAIDNSKDGSSLKGDQQNLYYKNNVDEIKDYNDSLGNLSNFKLRDVSASSDRMSLVISN